MEKFDVANSRGVPAPLASVSFPLLKMSDAVMLEYFHENIMGGVT